MDFRFNDAYDRANHKSDSYCCNVDAQVMTNILHVVLSLFVSSKCLGRITKCLVVCFQVKSLAYLDLFRNINHFLNSAC